MNSLNKKSKMVQKKKVEDQTKVNEGYNDERRGLPKENNPAKEYPKHHLPDLEKEKLQVHQKGIKKE